MRILFGWLGETDLRASTGETEKGLGPMAQAVRDRSFDRVVVLSDWDASRNETYVRWISEQTSTPVEIKEATLPSPTDFAKIYENVVRIVDEYKQNAELVFHISPGTPAMAAVWIIASKTRFPAELIQSSVQQGVQTVSFPFDVSAEYLPDLLHKPDRDLKRLTEGLPPEAPGFSAIIHKCRAMQDLIVRARWIAIRDVPILIQGESGTGKELFARAIHQSSLRNDEAFVPVNCGAIPENLMEAEFFGYERGAFTGADRAKAGHFEAASGGTLFLDEIGELPKHLQVKLLRAIEGGKITRIGSRAEMEVDVRIIAATNRDLATEVSDGRFREDLFHRLAVGVLALPPVRERRGDLGLLITTILVRLNIDLSSQPGFKSKSLAPGARSLLLQHRWPGNVRELYNTLLRAAIWSAADRISSEDVAKALLPTARTPESILGRPLGSNFDIKAVIDEVVRHYSARALEESGGIKRKAAELLGLPNYQTFSNWMKRHGVASK